MNNTNFSILPHAFDRWTATENYTRDDLLRVSLEYKLNDHWLPKTEELCLSLAFGIFMFMGLLGNGIVCVVIIRKGSKQSRRNWYILNLSVSDTLTCILCKPMTLIRIILKNWPVGEFLCRFVPFLQTTYVFVSTFTLVALAIDRYHSIVIRGNCTRIHFTVWRSLPLIWILSISMATPIFVVHRLHEVKLFDDYVLYTICLEQWRSQLSLTVYTICILMTQYLSPLIAIVILHLLIGRFLRMRVAARCSYRLRQLRKMRHRKNICILGSMAGAFAVTWLPLHVVNALASLDHRVFHDTNFTFIHAVCMLISFSSVCLNPLIYGLFNSNFRMGLKRLCHVDKSINVAPPSSQELKDYRRFTELCDSIAPTLREASVSILDTIQDEESVC